MVVASMVTRLALRLKLAVAWVGFYLLRFCEHLLPTTVLSLLLWPPAAAWNLMQLRPRQLLACWQCFPESWRQPTRWRFLFRQSLGLFHAQFISTWPDRLCTARWQSRCRLEGRSNMVRSPGDRGIVLASLHFGPSETLPYWLRAHGIVATTIRGFPDRDPLESLMNYRCALSPPSEVPVFLPVNEMSPLPRFRHIQQFLGPGRRLLVEMDVDRGIQFHVPFEDRLFRMATGAIRLAAMADAELIPCLIMETASWKFAIHFGIPVPRCYLGNSPDMQAIGTHLLKEFSKVIARYPEQCRLSLLSALSRFAVAGVGDRGKHLTT